MHLKFTKTNDDNISEDEITLEPAVRSKCQRSDSSMKADIGKVAMVFAIRGKWLRVCMENDRDNRGSFNSKSRQWIEKKIIPLYRRGQ
jgi:hypothetical protein